MTTLLARIFQLALTLYWYKRVSTIRFNLGYLFPLMALLGILLLLASYVNTAFAQLHWLVYWANVMPLFAIGLFAVFYLFQGNLKHLVKLNFQAVRHRV